MHVNPRCPRWLAALVCILILASALAVVWAQHQSRRLFIELQALQQEGDGLYERWSGLQLDYRTWGTHHRAEEIARDRLDMQLPQEEILVFVEHEE